MSHTISNVFFRLRTPSDYKAPIPKELIPRGVELPTLTDRQDDIITGAAKDVRKNEITTLLDKLTDLEMYNEIQEVENRYYRLIYDIQEEPPLYTPIETIGILQSLTPWRLNVKEVPVLSVITSFHERLDSVMSSFGITNEELSKKAGIGKQYITRYRNGNGVPNSKAMKAIAEALHIEVKWLAEGDEDPLKVENVIALYNKLDDEDKSRVYGLSSALMKDLKYDKH